MAGDNSQINFVGLDFDTIKDNLKTYLKSQDTFKDYNFEGSGLSVLLDVLAYNTQYNAFYSNMIANEMFLDTALQRSSVVSHAKLLNYVPQSSVASTAFVDVVFSGVNTSSFTIPPYTNFLSEAVKGVNYHFVTVDSTTVNCNTFDQTATFKNLELKQGIPVEFKKEVDSISNPNYVFELPDTDIDTSTIKVTVQKSYTNALYDIYNRSDSFIDIDGNSKVYFVEESLNGTYELKFGDGILGKKLDDGNIVIVTYIITQGTSAIGANNFVLLDSINNQYSGVSIYPYAAASRGKDKETLESIKFQAPKSFSAQNRAVTKDDYITLINQNPLGVAFDAVNVWGGEENDPPIYGQVFVCLKPKGALSITQTQKQELITKVLRPISVVTVEPKIIDPDYTFITLNVDVRYNPKLTNYSANQISNIVKTSISNYAANNLNTFNSTFSSTDVSIAIKSADPSIVTSDINLKIQKKIYPNLTTPTSYNLYYNSALERGIFTSGISNSPTFTVYDTLAQKNISGVYIEEIPSSTSGIQSISLINPGYSYQFEPTITISGDGRGATASAIVNKTNGSINSIQLNSSGNNYTYAVVTITPASNDTTGTGAAAIPILIGSKGLVRSYYYNSNNMKTIFNNSAGTIDYDKGIVSLNDFNPVDINDPFGRFTVTASPKSQIISSTYNTIVTIDPLDPNAIIVNVSAQ